MESTARPVNLSNTSNSSVNPVALKDTSPKNTDNKFPADAIKVETNKTKPEDLSKLNAEVNPDNLDKVLNQEAEAHPEETQEPSEFVKKLDKVFKKGIFAASSIGVVGSTVSAAANAILGEKSPILKKINSLQDVIARLAIGFSSAVSTYNNFRNKSLFKTLGYGYETLLSIFSKFDVLGLQRGICFVLYQIPEIASSVKPLVKSKNFLHDYSQIAARGQDILKFLLNPDSYSNAIRALGGDKKHDKLLEIILGAWGGLLSFAGVGWWMLTGDKAKAGLVKGIGESLVDFYHVTPNQFDRKRHFFIGSGLTFLVGSISEMISKQFNDNKVLANLYFAGTTLGRLQFSLSEQNKETSYLPSNKDPAKGPVTNGGPAEGWESREYSYTKLLEQAKGLLSGNFKAAAKPVIKKENDYVSEKISIHAAETPKTVAA